MPRYHPDLYCSDKEPLQLSHLKWHYNNGKFVGSAVGRLDTEGAAHGRGPCTRLSPQATAQRETKTKWEGSTPFNSLFASASRTPTLFLETESKHHCKSKLLCWHLSFLLNSIALFYPGLQLQSKLSCLPRRSRDIPPSYSFSVLHQ